jgi:hypothetical protein
MLEPEHARRLELVFVSPTFGDRRNSSLTEINSLA